MRRNIVLQLLAAQYAGRIQRTCWCIPRSKNIFLTLSLGSLEIIGAKIICECHETLFYILCNELRPYIHKESTNMRSPVTVEERVTVTVWKLATNIEYRSLTSLFGWVDQL